MAKEPENKSEVSGFVIEAVQLLGKRHVKVLILNCGFSSNFQFTIILTLLVE